MNIDPLTIMQDILEEFVQTQGPQKVSLGLCGDYIKAKSPSDLQPFPVSYIGPGRIPYYSS